MSRYIDADAFIEDIKTEAMNLFMDGLKGTPRPRKELYDIIDRIQEQPTADVVEVVRCKDCKNCLTYEKWNKKIYSGCCRNGEIYEVDSDHYCSYGERREG